MEKINDAYVLRHETKAGFEQNYLFMSDIHFDAIHCDRVQLKADLDLALELNAKILMFGDIYDAMGGKYDPRTSKDDIREEYNRGAYFDDITYDFVKFMKPYKDNIIFISDGNHESSVKKRHEIDLVERTIMLLNTKILHGTYSGFIRFIFRAESDGHGMSKVLYYTHGSGGNAPVTKGAIKTNRRQDMFQADWYLSGHIHTEYDLPRPQSRLNQNNKVESIKCEHWQLGCYKNDHLTGGWADQKEFPSPNIGGRVLQLFHDSNSKGSVKYRSFRTV